MNFVFQILWILSIFLSLRFDKELFIFFRSTNFLLRLLTEFLSRLYIQLVTDELRNNEFLMTFLLCLILILDIFVRYDMVAGLRVDHFYRICFPSLHSSLALFRITISSALLFTSFFKSCQKHNHQIIRVLTVH